MKTIFHWANLVCLICVLCAISCNEKKGNLSEQVKEMYRRKVNLCLDSMMIIDYSQNPFSNNPEKNLLSIVSFVDTDRCSPCVMQDLYRWTDFIDSVKTYGGEIGVFFIFEPSHSKLSESIEEARYIAKDMSLPIYIDSLHALSSANNLPPNIETHTFVLDRVR